ncbi:aspartate ammonia-lyase [Betaproteobacteria bacterium]|nr:aspartate ammonia-lyase [Betaproteobacteria bacterium]
MRLEQDSLGSMELSDEVYYGIQTKRAIDNFTISRDQVGRYTSFVSAIAAIKKAAALANADLSRLPVPVCDAIVRAADEVIAGLHADQFPIDIFQGGGGTPTNMNVNEVIANRATELLTGHKGYDPVHPNTHVNMGQSTNDVIPAAMKMAVYRDVEPLLQVLRTTASYLGAKEIEHAKTIKIGRTCLQDALPVTFGQVFSGYRSLIERQIAEVEELRLHLQALPLPGTAVGTCFGARPGFSDALYRHLEVVTNVPYRQTDNLFDGLQNADSWMRVSAVLKCVASAYNKIASDLRLMGSGPRAGFNEIILPAVQPGSSIMPGKVNPVIPEMMMQVAFRVFGNDATVSVAADRGELELNVWEGVILHAVDESIRLLVNSIPLFNDCCLLGLQINTEKCLSDAHASLALSTVIATLQDYPSACAIAHEAWKTGRSIEELVVANGLMTAAEAQRLLDPVVLTDIEAFDRTVEFATGRSKRDI